MGIFTESRETLSESMEDTLKILLISTNGRYSEEVGILNRFLLEKIDFTMSDSTAHNLKVIEKVGEDLDVDKVPSTILCNVHPLMMFQGKAKCFAK